jgi:hypothetical protein
VNGRNCLSQDRKKIDILELIIDKQRMSVLSRCVRSAIGETAGDTSETACGSPSPLSTSKQKAILAAEGIKTIQLSLNSSAGSFCPRMLVENGQIENRKMD